MTRKQAGVIQFGYENAEIDVIWVHGVFMCKEDWDRPQQFPVSAEEVVGTLQYRKFSVNMRFYFFSCEGGQTLKVGIEKLWSLQRLRVSPERYWIRVCIQYSADSSRWPWFEQWTGLVDLQRWLPTLSLLWFCENQNSSLLRELAMYLLHVSVKDEQGTF